MAKGGSGPDNAKRIQLLLLVSGLAYLVWSGIGPRDFVTWIEEVAPAVIGGAILVATYRRFRFSTLTYCFVWLFSLILMTGGHWTYARVPLGFWISDLLDLQRNHFDRLGHFFQGVIPALLGRELLLRTSDLKRGKWLAFILICISLAISATYELIEWAVAAAQGASAEAFLGTQGDQWDAQKDMLMATCGAVFVVLVLARLQDKSMRKIPGMTT
ncbi:MAG: DUF2238 domain-containing protein [Planctomycetes bacterium]|nr:DUF2238 domain-containing protein [Planctomycetota bacterium]